MRSNNSQWLPINAKRGWENTSNYFFPRKNPIHRQPYLIYNVEFCKRLNLALNCASFSESEQVTEKSTMTFRYTTKLKQVFFKKRKPWIIQRPTRRYIAKMPKVVRNVNTQTKKNPFVPGASISTRLPYYEQSHGSQTQLLLSRIIVFVNGAAVTGAHRYALL